MVELGTLITQAKTVRCGESNYPVLSMTMHDGLVLQDDRFKKAIASKDKSDYKVVYRDQLVISFPIDEGVLATQRITDAGIVSPAYGIWDVDQEKVVPEFLEYALRCKRSIAYYKTKLRGSTARRRSLPTPTLLAHTVPLPSIEEQKYVLDLIHKVETIIHLRKDELKELDALTKARFAELFGNPYSSDFKFEKCKLLEIATKVTDGEHGTVPRVNKGEGPLYVMARNITQNNAMDFSELSYIPQENHDKIYSRCNPEKGDLLLVCVGATVGKVALVPDMEPFSLARSVALIKPDKKIVTSEFLLHLMNSDYIQNQIQNSLHAAAQAGLYTKTIASLEVFAPPMRLQKQFSEFVEKIDKSKLLEARQAGFIAKNRPTNTFCR